MPRNGFLYHLGIGESKLQDLIGHYREHGAVTRNFYYRGRNKKAVTTEEATKVIKFLENVSSVHALFLPGRVSG